MKRNAIVRIVLFSIAIIVLVSMLAGGLLLNTVLINTDWQTLFQGDWELTDGTMASVGSVSPAEVKDIQIGWAAGSITIRRGDVNEITFSETEGLADKDKMIWTLKGDKLVIQYSQPKVSFGSVGEISKDLQIIVPRDWTCRELEIDAASARVEVHNLTIQDMEFSGASGTCILNNCLVDMLDADTASGDIRFTGTLRELEIDAASASCTLQLVNTPQRIDADLVSGDLDLTLPEGSGFTLELDALSGSFHSQFPTTKQGEYHISGDGSCRIYVSALSGDVTIRMAEKHES